MHFETTLRDYYRSYPGTLQRRFRLKRRSVLRNYFSLGFGTSNIHLAGRKAYADFRQKNFYLSTGKESVKKKKLQSFTLFVYIYIYSGVR